MKATGTAFEVLEACERATIEHTKTMDYLAPRTAKARLRYIKKKTKWDLFRRSSEYWANRWELSSSRHLTLQCNGTLWTRDTLTRVESLWERVNCLSSFDTFTLSDREITDLSYVHAEDKLI